MSIISINYVFFLKKNLKVYNPLNASTHFSPNVCVSIEHAMDNSINYQDPKSLIWNMKASSTDYMSLKTGHGQISEEVRENSSLKYAVTSYGLILQQKLISYAIRKLCSAIQFNSYQF